MIKIILMLSLLFVVTNAKDYRDNPRTKKCMRTLIHKYHFTEKELKTLFANVKVQRSALRAFIPRHKLKKRKGTLSRRQVEKAKRNRENESAPLTRTCKHNITRHMEIKQKTKTSKQQNTRQIRHAPRIL